MVLLSKRLIRLVFGVRFTGMREPCETKLRQGQTAGEVTGPSQAVTFNQMISPENRPLEAPDPYAPLKIKLCGIR